MTSLASRLRLVAAFAAGITAWESLVHASLLLSRAAPRVFGIRLAGTLNVVQTIVPGLLSVALARFAFSAR